MSPVRSAKFRPTYRIFFWIFLLDCVVLTFVGGNAPGDPVFSAVAWFKWINLGQIATLYYFAHFLVVFPLLGYLEKTKPLPASISEPVLKGGGNTPAGAAAGAVKTAPMEKA